MEHEPNQGGKDAPRSGAAERAGSDGKDAPKVFHLFTKKPPSLDIHRPTGEAKIYQFPGKRAPRTESRGTSGNEGTVYTRPATTRGRAGEHRGPLNHPSRNAPRPRGYRLAGTHPREHRSGYSAGGKEIPIPTLKKGSSLKPIAGAELIGLALSIPAIINKARRVQAMRRNVMTRGATWRQARRVGEHDGRLIIHLGKEGNKKTRDTLNRIAKQISKERLERIRLKNRKPSEKIKDAARRQVDKAKRRVKEAVIKELLSPPKKAPERKPVTVQSRPPERRTVASKSRTPVRK